MLLISPSAFILRLPLRHTNCLFSGTTPDQTDFTAAPQKSSVMAPSMSSGWYALLCCILVVLTEGPSQLIRPLLSGKLVEELIPIMTWLKAFLNSCSQTAEDKNFLIPHMLVWAWTPWKSGLHFCPIYHKKECHSQPLLLCFVPGDKWCIFPIKLLTCQCTAWKTFIKPLSRSVT